MRVAARSAHVDAPPLSPDLTSSFRYRTVHFGWLRGDGLARPDGAAPLYLGAFVITVENLSKSFSSNGNPVVALRDVSIDIDAGSLFGVVGPTGSGKSTLARCIGLQERPDRGVVRLDGLNTGTLDGRRLREVRRQVGILEAKPELHLERTVAGNIAGTPEQLGLDGPQRRTRVGNLLDLAGLTQRAVQRPSELTAGQRRRLALAGALAVGPAVLLADDPTVGIQPDEAGAVLAALDRARAE